MAVVPIVILKRNVPPLLHVIGRATTAVNDTTVTLTKAVHSLSSVSYARADVNDGGLNTLDLRVQVTSGNQIVITSPDQGAGGSGFNGFLIRWEAYGV